MLLCFYCHCRKKKIIPYSFRSFVNVQFLVFPASPLPIHIILKYQMEFGIRQNILGLFCSSSLLQFIALHLCNVGTFLQCCSLTGCKLEISEESFCCSVYVVSALPDPTHKHFSSSAKLARKSQNAAGSGRSGGQQCCTFISARWNSSI